MGGSARYGLDALVHTGASGFPWGTLTANVSGSFLLGLALALTLKHIQDQRLLLSFVATGVLGSYTTFSALAVETSLLLQLGRFSTAALYVASSLVLGLATAWTGLRLGGHRRAGSGPA